MKFADRFPSELGWAEAAILSTLVRKVIGSMCTEPWFSKNWCRIPNSRASYKKRWRGTLHKWMERNTARCLEKQITNFVSNRELKITQKSAALVRASADESGQKFNEFNRVIMILHLLRIWSDIWMWIYFNHILITTAVSWIPLYLIVLQQRQSCFPSLYDQLEQTGKAVEQAVEQAARTWQDSHVSTI